MAGVYSIAGFGKGLLVGSLAGNRLAHACGTLTIWLGVGIKCSDSVERGTATQRGMIMLRWISARLKTRWYLRRFRGPRRSGRDWKAAALALGPESIRPMGSFLIAATRRLVAMDPYYPNVRLQPHYAVKHDALLSSRFLMALAGLDEPAQNEALAAIVTALRALITNSISANPEPVRQGCLASEALRNISTKKPKNPYNCWEAAETLIRGFVDTDLADLRLVDAFVSAISTEHADVQLGVVAALNDRFRHYEKNACAYRILSQLRDGLNRSLAFTIEQSRYCQGILLSVEDEAAYEAFCSSFRRGCNDDEDGFWYRST